MCRRRKVPSCVRCVFRRKDETPCCSDRRVLAAVATLLAAPEGADGKRWWSYVEALANDEMQGRNTGSPEHRKAAEYVASQFERAGLKPAGVQGYIQPVKFDARKIVESQSSLDLIRNGRPERSDARRRRGHRPAHRSGGVGGGAAGLCRLRPCRARDEIRRSCRPRPEGQDHRHHRRRTFEYSGEPQGALRLRHRARPLSAAGRRRRPGDDPEPEHVRYSMGAFFACAVPGSDEPGGSALVD